jgi:hypothetical protein
VHVSNAAPSVAGLAGFFVVFIIPSLLQLAATRLSVRRWGEAGRATPHSTCLSGPPAVWAVLGFGCLAFVVDVWLVVRARTS